MKKFVNFIINYRWLIVLITPFIVIAFAYELKSAQFDGSYRIWFAPDSKSLQKYDRFKEVFGNDDSMIIVFRDEEGILTHKALGVIERVTEKLWTTQYIARVDSLTNYQYVHVNQDQPDDILVENFIEDRASLTKEQLREKEKIALNEDALVGRIISKDAKTTMIVARITPKGGNTVGASMSIVEAVNSYLEEENASGYEFYLAGGPVVNQTFSSLAIHDVTTFTPLVIMIVILLLWFVFRRVSGMLVSILVVIFTFTLVMSLQVVLGYKFNNFTVNMPVFIIAIAIADVMHLFWIYLLFRKNGANNEDAIYESMCRNFLPIFLTSITTAIGFMSLGISEIVPIQTLGIATATGALLAFVLSIIFVPAMLAILNINVNPKETQIQEEKLSSLSLLYAHFILKYDKQIILLSFVLFSFMAFGLTQLKVDSNAVKYFREDVPFRETVALIQKHLTGPMTYEIVADSKEKDGIKEPLFMSTVEQFSQELKSKFSDARHTSSLVDVVKKFNEIVAFNKSVPTDKNLIAQYLLLYSLSLPQGMEINDKMDVDERYLRISTSMNVVDTSKDLEMMAWIEEWWSKTPYSAEVNGQTSMFAYMQTDVTQTLIESITLAIVVISLVMFFIFRNIRMIPVFLIPNILPIVLVIGMMGWLGITIDIGVAISGAIILGIAVDDTIHFLLKYQEARQKGLGLRESLAYVIEFAGSAILFTTLILSCAFIVFNFSQFMLNANFGLVTAIALIIAVVVDLLLLPAILSRYDAGDKSKLIN